MGLFARLTVFTVHLFISSIASAQSNSGDSDPVQQLIQCGEAVINYSTQKFNRTMIFNIPPGQSGTTVFHWYGNNRDVVDYAKVFIDGELIKTLWVGYRSSRTCKRPKGKGDEGAEASKCVFGPVKWTNKDDPYGSGVVTVLSSDRKSFEEYFKDSTAFQTWPLEWTTNFVAGGPYLVAGPYHLEIHVPENTC